MTAFVARYSGWNEKHSGIEHIEASSRSQLLEKARAVEKETGLELVLIAVQDGLHQIWNAQRAARPERKGNGWWEDRLDNLFPEGFPEE